MLTKSDKTRIENMKRELLIMAGQLKDMAHENGEGDVFGTTIDSFSDALSSLKRETAKITFN